MYATFVLMWNVAVLKDTGWQIKENRAGVKTPCRLEDRGFFPEGLTIFLPLSELINYAAN
jgi:hypothetical protein